MATKYKVVITGPAGSGKTTAIQTLSDIDVVQTEAAATGQARNKFEADSASLIFQ